MLFPEYVSRSVKAGMEEGNILPSITATVTRFDGMDYRSIYSAASEDDKSLRYVGEGAAIPQTEVRASDHLVSLKKRGRMLVASYEAIRFQRLDLFSVMLRQIGNQIMRMHLEDAIDVIKNGDGNSNAATAYEVGDDTIGGTKGSLSYGELLNFWNCFDPYTMNTMLAAPDVMMKILKCSEFQNPLAGAPASRAILWAQSSSAARQCRPAPPSALTRAMLLRWSRQAMLTLSTTDSSTVSSSAPRSPAFPALQSSTPRHPRC